MNHRLRHPIRQLNEPFGKAGLTVAILALVLAMVGGAYAAGALSGKQKKEVEKIAKKFAGKPGAPGLVGANGTNGTNGAKGESGAAGAAGKSVTVREIPEGEPTECNEQGGAKVEKEGEPLSAQEVCNGENGETGFTETLPVGKTETGVWSLAYIAAGAGEEIYGSISFPIPLPGSVTAEFVRQGETEPGCTGSAEEPSAEEGHLCLYEAVNGRINAKTPEFLDIETLGQGAGKTGARLTFESQAAGQVSGYGTWAVTAE